MNLDIDTLLRLVGGWQDPSRDTHLLLRPAVRAMAEAYLGGGHDVMLPQDLAGMEEIDAFAAAAQKAQADFVEVVLLVDRAEALARFSRRPEATAWHSHNRRIVAEQGGPDFLGQMYDRLLAVVEARPFAMVVAVRTDASATLMQPSNAL